MQSLDPKRMTGIPPMPFMSSAMGALNGSSCKILERAVFSQRQEGRINPCAQGGNSRVSFFSPKGGPFNFLSLLKEFPVLAWIPAR